MAEKYSGKTVVDLKKILEERGIKVPTKTSESFKL